MESDSGASCCYFKNREISIIFSGNMKSTTELHQEYIMKPDIALT